MRGLSDLAAYLALSLVAYAAADGGEDYDYTYTDFLEPSGLDTADADADEMHELRCTDCKAIPKLATVRGENDGLSTPSRPIVRRTNANGADREFRRTTVVEKRDGVPWPYYASDFDHIVTKGMMIPIVNRVQTSTAERTTPTVATLNRVFDFRWDDVIKKTTQIPQ